MEYHGKLYGKLGLKYFDTGTTSEDVDGKDKKIKHLETIVQEAINLPKGIEPHSWSDYKHNKPSNDE